MNVERTEDHRYFIIEGVERIEAVSTTRAIIEANLVDDEYFTERGRMRGKIVHAFVEQIATGTLNRPIESEALGYLLGLRRFLEHDKPKIVGAESVLANLARLYGGTIDIEAIWKKFDVVYEVKTSQEEPWHGLQTAAYAYLKAGPKWMKIRRFGLYLTATGGYKLREHTDTTDLDNFFRALELLHWRIERGTHDRPYGRRRSDGGSDRSGLAIARYDEFPAIDDEFGQRGNPVDGDSPF